ncbi:FemAB family PEP-CTERM system-associated protein [Aestuariibacter sp. AA17]|uniref:FemAB family PEP-CTERM system-associated protein n=1 Tax=Fluctibacter corallii TaxID=2984329 RepID=A0ABT3ABI9_9ALTE|nr:FemAB family XrtA/PEP-CTERM system-associated protein [Aestuariibacter sp. AA17]MCV2886047.1 FemAB family PEP-CTERM system-associated protein [Aestuariibacter sp. AA17]
MQGQMEVRTLGDSESELQRWDAFVDGCEQGSFFHLSGWKLIVESVYRHKAHYLYVEQNGEITGVLPLVEQQSKLFGHSLISTPFCVYGGVASADEAVMTCLEDAAIALGHTLGVDYLELRYRQARNNPKLTEKCAHSSFGIPLGEDDEKILATVKKKQRAVIRHSLKNDLTYRVDQDVDTAYDIYSESVRNLGTPVFPKAYFRALKETFKDRCEVLTVEKEGAPYSSVLSFYYKGEVLPYYGGGTFGARALKSNDYMYYQLMCHAKANRDADHFDFGRSKDDSGAYAYKRSWGMEPVPLHYQFCLIKGDALPNLSPNNPKYQLLINTWKKLPVWMSRAIGPFVSKYLG